MNGKSLQMLTRSAVVIAAVLGTQIATATQGNANANVGRNSSATASASAWNNSSATASTHTFSQGSQKQGNHDNRSGLNGWSGTWQGSHNGPKQVPITSAVPEPETYAMMLAGLGLMGAIVRRRKNAGKK